MSKLVFKDKWIRLVMDCITTSSFLVIINGTPKGMINPQRGLRHGCLLSLYFFIICTKEFSNLLKHVERQKQKYWG